MVIDTLIIGGYDNERGKGDHKHIRNTQTRYKFVNAEKMVADFMVDVEKERGAHDD